MPSANLKPNARLSGRRVLVIEDEPDIRDLLTYNLQSAGYEVKSADSGEGGLELYEAFDPQVILLDLMLNGLQGTEVCRRIRAQKQEAQPAIIMLTAKGDEIDRVVGFELGADDYVVKPFSMRELLLRVNAMFRPRGAGGAAASGETPAVADDDGAAKPRRRLVVGNLQVDVDGHHAFVDGTEIHVSILEMRLLIYLMESKGRVRSREELLGDVWGYKPGVSTRTVDTHVKRLRDKLDSAGSLIETVRGMGYRFAEVPRTETT
ncbi:MAG: response regulator transcription factor [Deltaproteobacteria bacterium]|nr:response regulator transcription factor [Deltaproteobacteria bacterium]